MPIVEDPHLMHEPGVQEAEQLLNTAQDEWQMQCGVSKMAIIGPGNEWVGCSRPMENWYVIAYAGG